MNKPDIQIPASFAIDGIKTDFDNTKIQNGFDRLQPDVLAGDNLNKFIDDTYKGLNGVLDLYKGAVLYDVNETYSNKSIIFNIDENNKIKIYRSLVNNNIGNSLSDTDYWQEVSLGGGGLEIGDIGTALYVDETQGKRRRLNGSILAINENTQAFLSWLKGIVATNPTLSTTEANWQSEVTLSALGQCGKFVINEVAGTIRLPKVVNIQGLQSLGQAGIRVEESLPNITGMIHSANGCLTSSSGAFSLQTRTGNGYGTSDHNWYLEAVFNANSSNPIYQDDAPVQQEAIQYPYFIQIATGSETQINIINEVELNNPYSLFDCKYSDHELFNTSWLKSNSQWNSKAVYVKAYEALAVEQNTSIEVGETVTLPSGTSYTKQGLSVKLSTATYNDYDFVLNTTNETFRLPIKTNLASGKAVVGNGMVLGVTDGTHTAGLNSATGGSNRFTPIDTSYGENIGYNASTGTNPFTAGISLGVTSDSTKSGIETDPTNLYLYYYVGETVQNANLIDAGRISEQLSGLVEVASVVIDEYVNGTEGYRIWSSGYCEQWGQASTTSNSWVTITFLKTFKDTNYVAYGGSKIPDSSYATAPFSIAFRNYTTSSIETAQHDDNTVNKGTWTWKVSGYLAQGEY